MLITKVPKMLSISVMAHVSRERFFPELRERLGDVPFSIDHDLTPPRQRELGAPGLWHNCRAAWQMHDPEALYHVVIQDDAIVCRDFRARAEEAIYNGIRKYGSDLAFSFYFGNRHSERQKAAAALERGYITKTRSPWGVAICLPRDRIAPMIAYCDKENIPQDDVRIGRYMQRANLRCYFPLPSLVDHRPASDTLSLVGDPGDNRRALYFIDTA